MSLLLLQILTWIVELLDEVPRSSGRQCCGKAILCGIVLWKFASFVGLMFVVLLLVFIYEEHFSFVLIQKKRKLFMVYYCFLVFMNLRFQA
jgi:hypothetical protein